MESNLNPDQTLSHRISPAPEDEPATLRFLEAYYHLRRRLVQNGILEKQPAYYACKIFMNAGLLAVGLTLAVTTRAAWLHLFLACYLAFVSAQIAFIVHDAGHQQISNRRWKNKVIGLIHANLVLGFSYSWWIDKHNRHHGRPNQSGADPDIDFCFLAVSEEQVAAMRGLSRFLIPYQAYFFLPLLLLEAFSLKIESLRFLWGRRSADFPAEVVCLSLHYILSGILFFHFLGFWRAVIFVLLYNALFGLYLGLVFVTNHIGMPLLSADAKLDFLSRQVLTARNLRAHRLVDFCFGGLSCQIEHHLFPRIALNRLREAQKIIRPYCESLNIEYHETGLVQSYREIFLHLHEVGSSGRR
jgi:fatty acid desaturase